MRAALLALLVAFAPNSPFAQDTSPAAPATANAADPAVLDAVLVTGEQPGPGLWKVSSDDAHVLWILGTQSPLPKKMTWRAREIDGVIAQAQVVIAAPSGQFEIGFFRSLTLLPSLLGARKNADGATLQQVLSPQLYARWLALKSRYLGDDHGVERLRPMFAAAKLYDSALDKSGLERDDITWQRVRKAAKKQRVPIVEPLVKVPLDDPKQALADFKTTAGALDVSCLEVTITRLETDLDAMRQRANAWAVGDIDALRGLPYPDQREACRAALASNPRLGEKLASIRAQVDAAWLDAAQRALAANRVTLALLPIAELVKPDGRLAQLQAKGYAVEAPE